MMSAALAVVEPELGAPASRRFQIADLSEHGGWVMPRMLQAFPHMNERAIATFLRGVIYNSEYLFLYHEHGVALAKVLTSHMLTGRPVVQERFVWVRDKTQPEQVRAGAEFYVDFLRWARFQNAEVVLVEENTDIPREMINERMGKRLFKREQWFARV